MLLQYYVTDEQVGILLTTLGVQLARSSKLNAKDLNQQIAWASTGGVCDGNNIAACGVPVIDTMGVRGGSIHSMEEFLIVDSLSERAALSALTILRLIAKAA